MSGRGWRAIERSIADAIWPAFLGPAALVRDPFWRPLALGCWHGLLIGAVLTAIIVPLAPRGGPVGGVPAVAGSGTTAGRPAAVHGAPCALD